MVNELVLAPEVEQDLSDAFHWYNERRAGLGEDFLTCVDACIQSILRNPEMHAIICGNYRRAIVRRFPYSVFHGYQGSSITVYSVFQNAQNPAKWRRRIP